MYMNFLIISITTTQKCGHITTTDEFKHAFPISLRRSEFTVRQSRCTLLADRNTFAFGKRKPIIIRVCFTTMFTPAHHLVYSDRSHQY